MLGPSFISVQTHITPEILEPLVILLKSRDQQVQKAASLATSNFALNGPGMYTFDLITEMGNEPDPW